MSESIISTPDHKLMFEQAVIALAEIDSLLGIPDDGCNDPQVTVSAIKDLLSGLGESHPQPAELVEQQGVGITADWVLGYLNTDAPEDSRDAIRNAFTEWDALAATGKQQVGEACVHEWRTAGGGSQAHRPLVCSKCNQYRDHMPQQVGEVQGSND